MSNLAFDQLAIILLLFRMFSITFIALVVYKLLYRIWYEL